MANISISFEGIDQAIANLNYRPNSVKQKAISAIRAFYTSEESVKQLDSIDTDILIKSIWDVGDNLSKIKTKRRNFSSIKSSINADLEKLSKKKQNPENITISDSNVFDMTQEAKNNLLSSFSDAVETGDIDLDQATGLLKAVADFLEDYQPEDTDTDPNDIVNQIKNILNKITKGTLFEEGEGLDENAEEVDDSGTDSPGEDETLEEVDDLDEDIEEIELDEDEELEELDEDIEEIEIDENEELEEVNELDEDELKTLEEFREKKELAEQFDETLGEREKKYNKYVIVPKGKYTIGTKKSIKSSLELQQFDMPEIYIGIDPVTNSLFEIFIDRLLRN